jgi:peptide-methionine (S)-S-oxide reductase
MERAVFGASEFFSEKAFITGFRGIEHVQIGHVTERNLDIVEIWFNPWKVSYHELLQLFFDLHDPTSKEGQHYKNESVIFFSNINQLTAAKQKKNELKHLYKHEIITEVTPVWGHFNKLDQRKLIS